MKKYFILVVGLGVIWEDTVNGLVACRHLLQAQAEYPTRDISLFCGQSVVTEVLRS